MVSSNLENCIMSSNSNPVIYTINKTVVEGHTFSISNRYDFTNCRILGKGSYGVVAQATDTLKQQRVAIKRIRPYADDQFDARHTLREIRLMKLLKNHPNVCCNITHYFRNLPFVSKYYKINRSFRYMKSRFMNKKWSYIW